MTPSASTPTKEAVEAVRKIIQASLEKTAGNLGMPPWSVFAQRVVEDLTRLGHVAPVRSPQPPEPASVRVTEGIYIASKVKHAARWRTIASVDPISSTWIYEAGEGETSDFHDLWSRCLTEAATSKALVVYREQGEVLKGAWVEVGAALAHGVPVHAVGLDEFTIAKYRGITHHATMKEAMAAAIKEPARLSTALASAEPEGWKLECATEGCGKRATMHFERGGIGSYYCHNCYMRVQAIPAAPFHAEEAKP